MYLKGSATLHPLGSHIICNMEEGSTCRSVLFLRANNFYENRAQSRLNVNDSPMFDLLNIAEKAGLIEICFNMILNSHYYSKQEWSKVVWESVWRMEDEEFQLCRNQITKERLLYQVLEKPCYLTWWVLSDISRVNIEQYEIMARLVCDSSLLKVSNVKYKGTSIASRFCERCDLGIEESVKHIVMQCPSHEEEKRVMFDEINEVDNIEISNLMRISGEIFLYLMGKHPVNTSFESMHILWDISARHISEMYKRTVVNR